MFSRIFGLFLVCFLCASALLAQSRPSVERTVVLNGLAGVVRPIELRVVLQPEHVRQMDRVIEAAREALDLYGQWISPYPGERLTINDQSWPNGVDGAPRQIMLQTRWLAPSRAMETEAQVAHGVGWQWWGGGINGADDLALAEGLNRYLQDRILEHIFNQRNQSLARSAEQIRYFGAFVPWTFRDLRLSREDSERRDWIGRGDEAARWALAFGTLERYLGWPTLQVALSTVAQHFAGNTMTRADFVGVFNDTTGRDLGWFFDQVSDRAGVFDYAVDQLSSELDPGAACGAAPCYKTAVVVRRHGDRMFSGTGLVPLGDYEAGTAMSIRTRFDDGSQVAADWDGRAESKTIEYISVARALSAEIDPERTLLLDADIGNNSRTLTPVASRAASRWAMTWMVWLQDLLLTYAFFV